MGTFEALGRGCRRSAPGVHSLVWLTELQRGNDGTAGKGGVSLSWEAVKATEEVDEGGAEEWLRKWESQTSVKETETCPLHTLPPAPAWSCLTAVPAAYFAAQALGACHLGGQSAVNKGLTNCARHRAWS